MNEKTNSFKESIDAIEPSEGAKERMLQNIRYKAALQQNKSSLQQDKFPLQQDKSPLQQSKSSLQQDKSPLQQSKSAMPKGKAAKQQTGSSKHLPLHRVIRWAFPIAACLAITIIGIKIIPSLFYSPVKNNGSTQIVNPFTEVQSADEFAKQLGISIDAPDGSDNVAYNILDRSIANINFEYGEHSYTLRASKQSGDFSGINGTLIKYDKIDAANDAVLETIRGEFNYYKLTWTDGTTTYILMNNSEISTEDIIAIYELVK